MNYLFVYLFLVVLVFVSACGLSLVVASRGYLCSVLGLPIGGLFGLGSTGPRVCGLSSCGSWPLEPRLHSCGARA